MAITNVKEYDILPSRWDYFERRMEKLKEAAGRKIPPIEFNLVTFRFHMNYQISFGL